MDAVFSCDSIISGEIPPHESLGVPGAESEPEAILVRSRAEFDPEFGLLRVMHSCHIQTERALLAQPWMGADLQIEPMSESVPALRARLFQMHREYIRRARREIPSPMPTRALVRESRLDPPSELPPADRPRRSRRPQIAPI